MARKHTLPGVDEAALSELARQFPSHDVEPPAPLSQEAPESSSNPGAGTAVRSRGGSGIAVAVSVLALMVAAAPIAAPFFRTEISQWLDNTPVADAVLGGRLALERQLKSEEAERAALAKASQERIEQLNAGLARADARLEKIEAVGGGGFDAAARRVEAAEAAFAGALARVESLEGGLAQTRTGIEGLTSRLDEVGPAMQAKLAEIEPRLAEIEQRAVEAIEAKAASLEQELAGARERATKAEEAATAATAKSVQVEQEFAQLRQFNRSSVRLFLIALHLRTAVQTPAPFVREAAALRALVGDNPEAVAAVDTLTQYANGTRALSELRHAFVTAAGPQIKSLASGLDASWTTRLTSLVSGPQMPQSGEGEQVWKVVVQAEQALNQGNLAQAISHIERFDGPAGAIVADWLRDAKARLAVENAAAALSIYALNQLVGG